MTVAVSSPQGRFSADAGRVDGQQLDRIEAYGKHLFYWWHNGEVGHVHLGLFGKFRVHRRASDEIPDPVGEVRMRMISDRAVIDLAGPTACSVGTAHDRELVVSRLGPDPLRADARPAIAIERLRRSKQAVGALLLDQRVMSGVGNVYRAEALYVNAIHPSRPGTELSDVEADALWSTIVAMLRRGVKDNRIITVDRSQIDQPLAAIPRRGDATYVYHRDRCRVCASVVSTVRLGGRDCYYCPVCQPR